MDKVAHSCRLSAATWVAARQANKTISGPDASVFYDVASKRLQPEVAAHVGRLRDLQVFNQAHTKQAIESRDELPKGP